MADYTSMTDQEFDALLLQIVRGLSAEQILSYGDVNMILREEFNDQVLDLWTEENPDRAVPDKSE